jgi:biopolymer transport protein ExbB/TolQ
VSFVADAMREGGVLMWIILVFGIWGFAVALERFFFVFFRVGINAPAFMAQVQRAVLDGDFDRAVRICNVEPSAALPRVLKAGLIRANRPESEIRDAMEEEELELYPLITRRIAYLPMIANVVTLIGLLGTIYGLILSFQAVGEETGAQRSTALAAGIAVAMWPTLLGLGVAIPLLVANGVIAARTNAILDELDHHALKLVNLLNACRSRPGSHGGGAPVLPFPSG